MSRLTIGLRIRDMHHYRLFVWELRRLAERMRAEDSPYAGPLERLIERFIGEDDEDPPPEGDG